jgi:hypothetical protein
MKRTTVLIDPPILEELRQIADKEEKPLRKLINDFLAQGIRNKKKGKSTKPPRLKWHSQRMAPRVDYTDKEELYQALDEIQ